MSDAPVEAGMPEQRGDFMLLPPLTPTFGVPSLIQQLPEEFLVTRRPVAVSTDPVGHTIDSNLAGRIPARARRRMRFPAEELEHLIPPAGEDFLDDEGEVPQPPVRRPSPKPRAVARPRVAARPALPSRGDVHRSVASPAPTPRSQVPGQTASGSARDADTIPGELIAPPMPPSTFPGVGDSSSVVRRRGGQPPIPAPISAPDTSPDEPAVVDDRVPEAPSAPESSLEPPKVASVAPAQAPSSSSPPPLQRRRSRGRINAPIVTDDDDDLPPAVKRMLEEIDALPDPPEVVIPDGGITAGTASQGEGPPIAPSRATAPHKDLDIPDVTHRAASANPSSTASDRPEVLSLDAGDVLSSPRTSAPQSGSRAADSAVISRTGESSSSVSAPGASAGSPGVSVSPGASAPFVTPRSAPPDSSAVDRGVSPGPGASASPSGASASGASVGASGEAASAPGLTARSAPPDSSAVDRAVSPGPDESASPSGVTPGDRMSEGDAPGVPEVSRTSERESIAPRDVARVSRVDAPVGLSGPDDSESPELTHRASAVADLVGSASPVAALPSDVVTSEPGARASESRDAPAPGAAGTPVADSPATSLAATMEGTSLAATIPTAVVREKSPAPAVRPVLSGRTGIQRRARSRPAPGGTVRDTIPSGLAGFTGTPAPKVAGPRRVSVPEPVKQALRGSVGEPPSHVTVHEGAHAAEMTGAVNAEAFTRDGQIYLAGDAPLDSPRGQELLAHELTHVIQQGGRNGSLPGEHTHEGKDLEARALAVEQAMVSGAHRTIAPTALARPAANAEEPELHHRRGGGSWESHPPSSWSPAPPAPSKSQEAAVPQTITFDPEIQRRERDLRSSALGRGFGAAVGAVKDSLLSQVEQEIMGPPASARDKDSRYKKLERQAADLYPYIRARLRAELVRDRERRGRIARDWS